jgi:hypothetical protein
MAAAEPGFARMAGNARAPAAPTQAIMPLATAAAHYSAGLWWPDDSLMRHALMTYSWLVAAQAP